MHICDSYKVQVLWGREFIPMAELEGAFLRMIRGCCLWEAAGEQGMG